MAKIMQHANIVLILSMLVIFGIAPQIMAMPKPQSALNSLDRLMGCKIDSILQETCQRCAKATKSNVVYPMCCANEDEAYVWCQKYMDYGIHQD